MSAFASPTTGIAGVISNHESECRAARYRVAAANVRDSDAAHDAIFGIHWPKPLKLLRGAEHEAGASGFLIPELDASQAIFNRLETIPVSRLDGNLPWGCHGLARTANAVERMVADG